MGQLKSPVETSPRSVSGDSVKAAAKMSLDQRKRSIMMSTSKKSLTVTKAAVISSAMLARKNSAQRGAATTRESIAALAEMLSTADIRRPHSGVF